MVPGRVILPPGITLSIMAENLVGTATAVTESICLEELNHPLHLPCGHSFCPGCMEGWRSRYGAEEDMRRKCPICRAGIPPSKEMVATMLTFRADKQRMEDNNETSSEQYHITCYALAEIESWVGVDWDGVTILEDSNGKPAVAMPEYIFKAIKRGDIRTVLRWINANRTEDRVNAVSSAAGRSGMSSLLIYACMADNLTLMSLLLQLGANVDYRASCGITVIGLMFYREASIDGCCMRTRVRLLLSWGLISFPTMRTGGVDENSAFLKPESSAITNLLIYWSPSSREGGAKSSI